MTSSPPTLWSPFVLSFEGPDDDTAYTREPLLVRFKHGHRTMLVPGYYAGNGRYAARLLVDAEGAWSWSTESTTPALDGQEGRFVAGPAEPGRHGPVRVARRYHFAYADGTPHYPVGTTCYAWIHQPKALIAQTLETLATAPFNKLRMCLFPKWYRYNEVDPERYAFVGNREEGWDYTRFDPVWWAAVEELLTRLMDLGIEADLILFHPYDHDRWGFDKLPREVNERYLRYAVARLAGFPNVWWSLANEWDLCGSKTHEEFAAYALLLREHDHAQHLVSNHNCNRFFDHLLPTITHCSVQHHDMGQVAKWREQYGKPVVCDEVGYEGTIGEIWGNLTPQELVHRHWLGFSQGGYVGHGETYLHPDEVLWWSKGGVLHGEAAPRLRFLREVLATSAVPSWDPAPFHWNQPGRAGDWPTFWIQYFGNAQPGEKRVELPDGAYRIEILDTWNMTVDIQDEAARGVIDVKLPARPYIAARFTRTGA